jgi:aldose 1-epimerase
VYEIQHGTHPDVPEQATISLVSPANVRATFVPRAGMVCASLMHDDEEMLGQRYGLAGYLETGRTFGIPILAPWANRLGRMAYAVVHEGGGIRRIDVHPETPNLRFDASGLPIHGLLRGSPDWVIVEQGATATEAWLVAQLHFDQRRVDFSAFPFEHRIDLKVTLRGTSLTFSTEIHAVGQDEVPIAFGWHPYLSLPGAKRSEWEVYIPFTRRCPLDDRLLPTGTREDVEPIVGTIGERALDDLFAEVTNGTTAYIRGNGRKMSIRFDHGYDWAILYGPPHRNHICIEPMTAASDPFSGQDPMEVVPRGKSFRAAFTITVDRTS